MDAHLRDWLHLAFRWFHIIAGIAWIGNSLFFMWLDKAFAPPEQPKEGVAGELYMIHGGFFYRVEKQKPVPGMLPKVLHWFKWEATLTWISGFFLLVIAYYYGGLMTDPSVAKLANGKAVAIGLATLAGGFLFYDLLWRALGKVPLVAGAISLAALALLAYWLSHVLSGRAAFMHVGALLGTCMVLNVWLHILPPQRRMVADLAAGRPADFSRGDAAKRRSTHNTYMTFPVIYVMLSNHFFLHYSHTQKWLVLAAMMLIGALVRHAMMTKNRSVAYGMVAAAVVGLIVMVSWTRPKAFAHHEDEEEDEDEIAVGIGDGDGGAELGAAMPMPAERGRVKGVIRYAGTPPARAAISMTADCQQVRGGTSREEAVVTGAAGELANVVVHVSEGWQRWQVPEPTGDVVVDQKGCTYAPHVVAARVGQTVTLLNSDPFAHNTHGYIGDETAFNDAMPNPGMKITKRFDDPALFVQLKCDIHPWMNARLAILEQPWFAVTADDGAFTLADLPPGDYTIAAVHETLGEKTAKVTIAAGAEASADFSFP